MKTFNFSFNGHTIAFDFISKDKIWVDATEMANIYGKLVKDFLKTDETKKMIVALKKRIIKENDSNKIKDNNPLLNDYNTTELFFSRKNMGTIMHRKLAIEFAGWLDIEFKIWMIETIEEIVFKEVSIIKNSVEKSAIRKTQIKKLETKLMQQEDYRTMLKLQAEERKASRERKNYITDNDPKFNI